MKNDKENNKKSTETRTKSPPRDDKILLKTKIENAVNIIDRQISKIEKAKVNAIKSGQIEAYNKVMDMIKEKFASMQIPENAEIQANKKEVFVMDDYLNDGGK